MIEPVLRIGKRVVMRLPDGTYSVIESNLIGHYYTMAEARAVAEVDD